MEGESKDEIDSCGCGPRGGSLLESSCAITELIEICDPSLWDGFEPAIFDQEARGEHNEKANIPKDADPPNTAMRTVKQLPGPRPTSWTVRVGHKTLVRKVS